MTFVILSVLQHQIRQEDDVKDFENCAMNASRELNSDTHKYIFSGHAGVTSTTSR
jgi:hypothetical protein